MHVLVLNCGSSSVKYQLIEMDVGRALARGVIERVGSDNATEAIRAALDRIKGISEIESVGHRVVHGGESFPGSVVIDDAVLQEIEKLSSLAPLHNPQNLKGYYATRKLLPNARQVAVFDTSFHHTLPVRAYLYGIPYEFYTRDKLRRYGFHGTSYRYVSARYAELRNAPLDKLKLVACHLGNGCSVCAIDRGKSIDTSMGFTPMDGLLMGTRPGELDPAAVLYLVQRDPQGADGVQIMLNQRSGLLGLTGGTSDMRDLLKQRDAGNDRARDAVDVFCYRVVKYIAAYSAVLGGADAILFTGGIGENAAPIRAQVCEGLRSLGVELNSQRNDAESDKERLVTADEARLPAYVIPTNEELMIARDTFRLTRA